MRQQRRRLLFLFHLCITVWVLSSFFFRSAAGIRVNLATLASTNILTPAIITYDAAINASKTQQQRPAVDGWIKDPAASDQNDVASGSGDDINIKDATSAHEGSATRKIKDIIVTNNKPVPAILHVRSSSGLLPARRETVANCPYCLPSHRTSESNRPPKTRQNP